MNKFNFQPTGICASDFEFSIVEDTVLDVVIKGGCPGNLLGISALLKNKSIKEIKEAFEVVKCGSKPTSCPEQIAIALDSFLKQSD